MLCYVSRWNFFILLTGYYEKNTFVSKIQVLFVTDMIYIELYYKYNIIRLLRNFDNVLFIIAI